MTGVSVSSKDRIVTTMDVRDMLESEISEVQEFVKSNVEENVWEYFEVEMFKGVFIVMDWSQVGVRDTYILIDRDRVEGWYDSPTNPVVTTDKTEVVEVSEDVAWAMDVFRDDVSIADPFSQSEFSNRDRLKVSIDNSGRVGPRFLTKLLQSVEGIEEIPSWVEYSESNSDGQKDMWV